MPDARRGRCTPAVWNGRPRRRPAGPGTCADAARRASAALREARASLENGAGLELAAVDLRQAMACLGEITGDQVEERLLDEVFGRFCVGK